MRAFLSLVAMISLAFGSLSCGNYHESHIKEYRMYFNTNDTRILKEVKNLIRVYNQDVGYQVLHFVDTPSEANSTVLFTRGLRESEGKLGFGRWETDMYQEPDFRRLEGRTLERVIQYSMELEFDVGFFEERLSLPSSDPEWHRLYLLFCHEVGHGLQMIHADDEDDVMYPVIKSAEHVRFDAYFSSVRAFLQST